MKKLGKKRNQRFTPSDIWAKRASDLDAAGGDATRNLQHSIRQVTERHYLRKPTGLVSLLEYDLGYFDKEQDRVEPGPDPFAPDKVLTMCPE